MATGGIRFPDLALGHAVETKKQVIEPLLEEGFRAHDHRLDIIRIIEIRWLNGDAHLRSNFARDRFDALDCAFETRHRIMWKQGDQQEVGDVLGFEILDGGWNRRVLIAHGQLDRYWNEFLQLRL